MGVGLLSAGIAIGLAAAGLREGLVVSADAGRAWTPGSKESNEVTESWRGAAAHVEITTAGLSIAGRYRAACEQQR
jgi:hypothetical protein